MDFDAAHEELRLVAWVDEGSVVSVKSDVLRAVLEGIDEQRAELDLAEHYLSEWQEWAAKLHYELGLLSPPSLPDDTKAREAIGALVRAWHIAELAK